MEGLGPDVPNMGASGTLPWRTRRVSLRSSDGDNGCKSQAVRWVSQRLPALRAAPALCRGLVRFLSLSARLPSRSTSTGGRSLQAPGFRKSCKGYKGTAPRKPANPPFTPDQASRKRPASPSSSPALCRGPLQINGLQMAGTSPAMTIGRNACLPPKQKNPPARTSGFFFRLTSS